ncbi:hypothetical protein Taro_017609 [Colocasia esculenta]|uniref:DUF4219 domain-containing protein n=1 Tax=Colocasia esculenta TaxID=4460 RepID=A0A843UP46_COLES|nr:hypothetical protein [Colocasia esculenta]
MAAQGHSEGQSVNRPPLFDGEDYTYWKTRMEYFLQGRDYQIWSTVEEGDLLVANERDKWTEDDKKKISLNRKAKSILCCALSKKEFNIISASKSAMEMWEKLRITYEGTDKVKETRIDILKLFPSKTMASSGVFGIVGGYRIAFLTAEYIVAAMDRLKWTKIATLSEVSYPDLVKAFYVCLKTEEDGTLTSMVKGTQIRGEAIIGEAQEDQEAARAILVIQEEQAVPVATKLGAAAVEVPTVEEVETTPAERAATPSVEAAAASAESCSKIEDIPLEDIEPVGQSSEDIPPSSRVASILRNVLGSIQGTQKEPVIGGDEVAEDVTPGHTEEITMEEAPSQGEQEIAHENIIVEDSPIEGEQSIGMQAAAQGEHNASAPIDDHLREGLVESASEDKDDVVELVVRE